MTPIKVLFVCHGNICRSPMAEFIFKDMLKKQGLTDFFEVASAATSDEEIWNGIGNPVYPPAKRELASHGIRSDGKRARQMTYQDYDDYDFLIGMDCANIRNMKRIAGGRDEKISLLLTYAGRNEGIADPWYSGDFSVTYRDIVDGLNGFMDFLRAEKILSHHET